MAVWETVFFGAPKATRIEQNEDGKSGLDVVTWRLSAALVSVSVGYTCRNQVGVKAWS